MHTSRRRFFQGLVAGGIAFSFSRIGAAAQPDFDVYETLPARHGWNPAARGLGRIDGVAKVTGAKLYASDFRAADMPGWPGETAHALFVRTPDATHVWEGLELDALPSGARPDVVVTAADLEGAGVEVPDFYAGDLFCPPGTTPLYLGQPLAILIFESFDAFDQARLAFRQRPLIRFGRETGPTEGANYGAFRFTRIAGPTPDAPDVYSPLQEGWVSPGKYESGGRPIWAPLPISSGRPYARAATYGEEIRAALGSDDPGLLVLERDFETQSVDPMFLEPECGLAWFDPGERRLAHGASGSSRPSRRPPRSGPCSGRRAPASGPSGSTSTSPISAAASVDATIRRSRSTSRSRRCSRPGGRCVSRTTATSSSRPA